MSRADEQFQRGVERVDHLYVGRQRGRVGDGTERGVDLARRDGCDGHTRVADPEGHDVEVRSGMRSPVLVQDHGLRTPQSEYVDPKRPGARAHRGDRALDPRDEAPRMRKKRLPVERQLHAPGGTTEQPYRQLALQRGDPLGHRLLRHARLIGRKLKPPEFGGPDERSQCLGVHGCTLSGHNQRLWVTADGLRQASRRSV